MKCGLLQPRGDVHLAGTLCGPVDASGSRGGGTPCDVELTSKNIGHLFRHGVRRVYYAHRRRDFCAVVSLASWMGIVILRVFHQSIRAFEGAHAIESWGRSAPPFKDWVCGFPQANETKITSYLSADSLFC
jgi:hypothetical protein